MSDTATALFSFVDETFEEVRLRLGELSDLLLDFFLVLLDDLLDWNEERVCWKLNMLHKRVLQHFLHRYSLRRVQSQHALAEYNHSFRWKWRGQASLQAGRVALH